MTTYFGKICSFGLLCMSLVKGYEFVCVLLAPFSFESGIWDLILLFPDPCILIISVSPAKQKRDMCIAFPVLSSSSAAPSA